MKIIKLIIIFTVLAPVLAMAQHTGGIGRGDHLVSCIRPSYGGKISVNLNICMGQTPEIITSDSLPAGHTGILVYQWQRSNTSGIQDFADISGATGTIYQPPALTDTAWFRRLSGITCNTGWVTSNTVMVAVYPVFSSGAILTSGDTICAGSTPETISSSTPASGGDGEIVYKWQLSTTSALTGYTDITGATSLNYTPSNLSTTAWFRRLAKEGNCNPTFTASSGVWKIQVDPVTVGGTISGDTLVCYGSHTSVLTLLGSVGTVQMWQYSTGENHWSDLVCQTSTTYTAVNQTQDIWYRAAVKSGVCQVEHSDPHLIRVFKNYKISGYVQYENNPKTPLNGLKITLKKNDLPVGPPVVTSNTGYYEFSGLVNGNYSLEVASAYPGGQWQTWGGVNNTDALIVNNHIMGITLLPTNPPVIRATASVVLPHPAIDNSDYLAIRKAAKYPSTGYTYFNIPKWIFSGITAAEGIDGIELSCANVTRNIRGLCAGDVNGTYVPPSGYKTAVETLHATSLQLQHRGTLPLSDELIFPIRVDRDMELGAITLYLDFDPSVMIVTNVTNVTTVTNGPELWYNVSDPTLNLKPSTLNTLAIGWMSLDPVTVAEGQAVILVHARLRDGANPIRFTLNENPLSELANGEGEIVDGVILMMPEAREQIPGTLAEEFILSVFPNPSNEIVNIDYLLAREEVTDFIFINSQGFPVLKSDRILKAAGVHRETLDVSGLIPGVYMLKATAGSAVSFRKVVVVR